MSTHDVIGHVCNCREDIKLLLNGNHILSVIVVVRTYDVLQVNPFQFIIFDCGSLFSANIEDMEVPGEEDKNRCVLVVRVRDVVESGRSFIIPFPPFSSSSLLSSTYPSFLLFGCVPCS